MADSYINREGGGGGGGGGIFVNKLCKLFHRVIIKLSASVKSMNFQIEMLSLTGGLVLIGHHSWKKHHLERSSPSTF